MTENGSTTCSFARNVQQAYLAAGLDGTDGTVTAYSDAVGASITMRCSGKDPARCEGGKTASVQLRPAAPVLSKDGDDQEDDDSHRMRHHGNDPDTSGTYYPNCAAARRAGAAPLLLGHPGYRKELDADQDGVACEWRG